jgi:protein involved in polysaccharide export with SLBB domain
MPTVTFSHRIVRLVGAALAFAAALAGAAAAQTLDPLNTGPRGLTELPALPRSAASAPQATSAPSLPMGAAPAGTVPATPGLLVPRPTPNPVNPAMPPEPATSAEPIVFGSQMFTGRFGAEPFAGFNPDYQIAIGDRVSVRMWGGFTFEASQAVDVQGNIFIPSVGPIAVRGVRNGDLNKTIEAQVKKTFRSNVGVYATLDAALPVKVYVTGFVRAPGLYGGLSSDSVLYYLDRAGGIDPLRGSYLRVDVLRGGKLRASVNLYDFLLGGRIDPLQLQDGDAIVAQPRQHTVRVSGEVLNPYIFELLQPEINGRDLLALARPRPAATHLAVVRNVGTERRSEYHAIGEAAKVTIRDGDEVVLTSDQTPGTILVRVEGSILSERTLVLPYGARLRDAIGRIRPAPQARMEALQLYRPSVAQRQKELIETSLRSLETYALTARSATSEEAALRGREAQQILEFIERARQVQPRGQVVIAEGEGAGETLLEDGDVLRVPEQSNLVLVSGEVLFPNALVWDRGAGIEDYVARSGGYTQGADRARLIVLRQDGSVADATKTPMRPGDQLMVLPKIETKSVELTRGISQIVYQIAVAAKVLFGL